MAGVSSNGFPPIAGTDACVLVLGSLPGERSIAMQQYYAHPRNGFWPIMEDLLGITGEYEMRCEQLIHNRIAVWDVLARSVRPGSLDADIQTGTAQANRLHDFLREYPDINRIVFNGKKARQLFDRFFTNKTLQASIKLVNAPSTSPAYAAMPVTEKRDRWAAALAPVINK